MSGCEYKVNQGELLDAILKERRKDLKESTREKLSSISKSIENKALMILLERPRQGRAYGLPLYWSEFGREQIWQYILKFVNEPQGVINMSETCVLFQRLLDDKYRAAKLAEALEVCVRKNILPPDVLLNLRLVCRTTKNFVDLKIMKGNLDMMEENGCFEFLIPGLTLAVNSKQIDVPQPRLNRILSSLEVQNVPTGTFPLREVILDEEGVLDLQHLQNSARRLFELVGDSITSLGYFTEQNSQDTYNVLLGLVSLLPNLEEIIVGPGQNENHDADTGSPSLPCEPFPTLSKLKRFSDFFVRGLSSAHLVEILRANPTLQLVSFSHTPGNRLNSLLSAGILYNSQLQVFIHESKSSIDSFFGRQIKWPLTRLEVVAHKADAIPAGTFFTFVNQFGETLKVLKALVLLSNICTCGTGGMTMMNLPNLVKLQWWLQNDSQTLLFMIPLKKLQQFDIFVPPESTFLKDKDCGTEGTLEFLERFRVPMLFPEMRRIRAARQTLEEDEDYYDWLDPIWENGSAIQTKNGWFF